MDQKDSALRFGGLIDLASADLGGRVLMSTDDFFATHDNLVTPSAAVFDADRFTDRGKWMDGWESRRKRTPGHDWCVLELGAPGRISAVDIDTSHFLGNHPPFGSIEACRVDGELDGTEGVEALEWRQILPASPLLAGSHNLFTVQSDEVWTHLRLHIYPAGGVARLRVMGEVLVASEGDGTIDLVSALNGGRALVCSDMFFAHMGQLLLPRVPEHMGDGWETRRKRGPGHDWIICELGVPGELDRVELLTTHFKGNYPDSCTLDGLYWPDAPMDLLSVSDAWRPVVGSSPLSAHAEHVFDQQIQDPGPFTHVRLNIYPDGGVSRLRCHGRPATMDASAGTGEALIDHLNGLDEAAAQEALKRCCGSTRWVSAMLSHRPYVSRAQLFGQAEYEWWRLFFGDWLEAFAHHPRIGADVDALRERFATTSGWAEGEQSGVQGASEETLQALAQGNSDYQDRFGHIFIVCATGKSAEEMLGLLTGRMNNPPEQERFIAAGEQAKITRLRLEKLAP